MESELMCKNKDEDKNKNPQKDVLTPIGDLLWKKEEEENSIDAEDMFNNTPISGSAGVEC